jgi:NADH-quinone oxidoreductase subunit A
MTPTWIVGSIALFFGVGFSFLLVNLCVGRLLRPNAPSPEKLEIYECGEAAGGSSFVQFALRVDVVALVVIVFDVEVAFLFPAATVFGLTTQLTNENLPLVAEAEDGTTSIAPVAADVLGQLGDPAPGRLASTADDAEMRAKFRRFVVFSMGAIGVFFVVLLAGFAYEWKTGAFEWVRALTSETAAVSSLEPPPPIEQEEPAMV